MDPWSFGAETLGDGRVTGIQSTGCGEESGVTGSELAHAHQEMVGFGNNH